MVRDAACVRFISSKVSREGTSVVRESFDLLHLAFNYTSYLSYLCNTDTLMSVLSPGIKAECLTVS